MVAQPGIELHYVFNHSALALLNCCKMSHDYLRPSLLYFTKALTRM